MTWSKHWDPSRADRPLPTEAQAFEAPCAECGAWRRFARAHGLYCGSTCRSAAWRRDHPVVKHIAPEFAT